MNKILCDNGCGKEATYTTKGGKHQCAPHHRSCPAVLQKGFLTNMEKYGGKTPASSATVKQKMAATSLERYGVANASSSTTIKEKRKQVMLERYGVENPSYIDEVKEKISEHKTQYWNGVYQGKDFTVDGLSRKQYAHRAHQYVETQYQRYKQIIDPENKRGKHWHLDHIYSVTDGFLNNVPINIISDISNLRLISDKENYTKSKSSHKSLEALYEDYQASIKP
jgi:CHAT domain-containing protein